MFKKLNEAIKIREEELVDKMLAEELEKEGFTDEILSESIDVDNSVEGANMKENIHTIIDEVNANLVDDDDELIDDETFEHELSATEEVSDDLGLDDDEYEEDIDDLEEELVDNKIKDLVLNTTRTEGIDIIPEDEMIDPVGTGSNNIDEDELDELEADEADEVTDLDECYDLSECAELVID